MIPGNIMTLISLWPSIVHTSELTSNHCQHYDFDFTLAERSMFAVCFRFDLSLQTVESCQLGPVSLSIDSTNTCTWNQIKSNQIKSMSTLWLWVQQDWVKLTIYFRFDLSLQTRLLWKVVSWVLCHCWSIVQILVREIKSNQCQHYYFEFSRTGLSSLFALDLISHSRPNTSIMQQRYFREFKVPKNCKILKILLVQSCSLCTLESCACLCWHREIAGCLERIANLACSFEDCCSSADFCFEHINSWII